ncbi:Putative membrane protein [Zobellia galactanivorans]|uniref:Putative membrane protein n=1 Tax=Zobellia galactanivorans (strain DSM 12802 / CCUG 47099 / CIP 106680 / NCIMB 13871 / Dsij) TaxID=63186 RepID=G0LA56_ZOBGA|nr:Putative membrane protein [Zobellia galactanivorans]
MNFLIFRLCGSVLLLILAAPTLVFILKTEKNSGRKKAIYLIVQINGFLISSGDWTRTSDLWVVSLTKFSNFSTIIYKYFKTVCYVGIILSLVLK